MTDHLLRRYDKLSGGRPIQTVKIPRYRIRTHTFLNSTIFAVGEVDLSVNVGHRLTLYRFRHLWSFGTPLPGGVVPSPEHLETYLS